LIKINSRGNAGGPDRPICRGDAPSRRAWAESVRV